MQIKKTDFVSDAVTRDVLEDIFSFFGTLSPEGYVLSLKGKVFERTGTDPELLIGQKFSETVYWQSSEHTSGILENALENVTGGEKSKTTLDFRVNAEEKIIIELTLRPLNDSSNQIFFCAQEVTDREKEIEFYKQRGEQLLYAAENADVGLWFWDLVEDKIFSTPKCSEVFGVPAGESVTLHSVANILHPEDKERVEAALTESQTYGKDYNEEFRVIYPDDGSVHWVKAKGKTYLDAQGEPLNMMGLVKLITENKIASEELEKIYEREKKARDEAEEANRSKDFFLAIVSHELRSPLNAILGWTKILLTKELDKETSHNALETIERSARAQAKLIEDLVDSARIASGKMRLEYRPTNLYEVIRTVFNSQKPAAGAKHIDLEFDSDKTKFQVFADSVRLQQVFGNIVSNSIKFTPEGGSVIINVSTDDERVVVSVKDNGQGIGAESLPNIFRQFSQGDEKTTRDRSGLGLGLSIAKILVEKHNGTIRAESEGIGKGAEFIVELPLVEAEDIISAEIKKSKPKKEKLLKDLKILLVEDDPDSRQVLQLVLEQCGATVESADSAEKALNILADSKSGLPNVIVSDLAMPVEDGYSLIKRIRRFTAEDGGNIPAIALTAFVAVENKLKAFKVGFQKYHTKPFDPDTLIEDILQVAKNS